MLVPDVASLSSSGCAQLQRECPLWATSPYLHSWTPCAFEGLVFGTWKVQSPKKGTSDHGNHAANDPSTDAVFSIVRFILEGISKQITHFPPCDSLLPIIPVFISFVKYQPNHQLSSAQNLLSKFYCEIIRLAFDQFAQSNTFMNNIYIYAHKIIEYYTPFTAFRSILLYSFFCAHVYTQRSTCQPNCCHALPKVLKPSVVRKDCSWRLPSPAPVNSG